MIVPIPEIIYQNIRIDRSHVWNILLRFSYWLFLFLKYFIKHAYWLFPFLKFLIKIFLLIIPMSEIFYQNILIVSPFSGIFGLLVTSQSCPSPPLPLQNILWFVPIFEIFSSKYFYRFYLFLEYFIKIF